MHWDSGRTTSERVVLLGGSLNFFWSSCLFAPLFLSCVCLCVCVREREREREKEREFFEIIFFNVLSIHSIPTGFGGGWCVQF